MNQQTPPQDIYPTPQDENSKPNQSSSTKKVSFWKSKEPAIVTVRIILYIFVGVPLLVILGIVALYFLAFTEEMTVTLIQPQNRLTANFLQQRALLPPLMFPPRRQ